MPKFERKELLAKFNKMNLQSVKKKVALISS